MPGKSLLAALLPVLLISCTFGGVPTAVPTFPPTRTPPPIPTHANAAESELTPTAFVPTVTQLTQPGCCVQPFWSADGQMVLFINKPQPTSPNSIYGVPITGGDPVLVSERLALPSPDGRYHTYLNDQGQTIVEPTESEVQWTVPNGGQRVFFSPHSERLAWAKISKSEDSGEYAASIGLADIDGSDVKGLLTLYGGGIGGWLDDNTLLLVGKDKTGSQDLTLFSLNVVDGTRRDLISNQPILTTEISPTGAWIEYTIASDSADQGGLWVIKSDASQRYKLEVVGGAHWRDASHLLIIPTEAEAASQRLWEFDAETGQAYPLTDPAVTPFKALNGDWSVAPTGDHVAFYGDNEAIWMITLPPAGEEGE